MPALVYVDGGLYPPELARVSVLDRGFLYGDGLFETMRAYGGHIFHLRQHLARLAASAEVLRIPLPHSPEELAGIVNQVLARSTLSEACVRLALTRGTDRTHGGSGSPALIIWVRAFTPGATELYERGVRVLFARYRVDSTSFLARHKTTNYLLHLMAREDAREAGAFEAILLNERGEITEGAASNLFIVRDGRVLTPLVACGLLPGITRAAVMEICAAIPVPCCERILRPGDLLAADEVFLTNSLVEVMPVTDLAGRTIGTGQPGPVTQLLAQRYRELVDKECRSPHQEDGKGK